MAEKSVEAKIGEAFKALKELLAESKCKVISEEEPTSVTVVQGSLWGTSPETAQKEIIFTLRQDNSRTNIKSASTLTSGYINLTLAGYVVSVVLIGICVWIALDLQAYVSTGALGMWSWLAQIYDRIDMGKAAIFIRLTWVLVAFLAATLVAESVIVWNVRRKIGAFAEKKLHDLSIA